MTKRLFITATDTDAGKTYVANLLTLILAKQHKVAVFKPISAGCERVNGQLVNQDAWQLHQGANCGQSLVDVNPFAFEPAIAPHIAAAQQNISLTVDAIELHYQACLKLNADFVLTEGAGGWRLPLNQTEFLSDFAINTKQQVVLVVNMKLGCLNHALLTYQAIINDGLTCIGWVANSASSQQMSNYAENLASLTQLLPVPLLAQLGFEPNLKQAAQQLDLQKLLDRVC